MRLRVQTYDTNISVIVENAVIKTKDRGKVLLEISCPNHDAYRFTYSSTSQKDMEKFEKNCKYILDALDANRESFFCSMLEFRGVKFEKSSLCSHID